MDKYQVFSRECVCGHSYGQHKNDDCPLCNKKNCFLEAARFATIDDFMRELNS